MILWVNLSYLKYPKVVYMPRIQQEPLQRHFKNDNNIEVGVDEAGRGPMLGRIYTGAVILPKDDTFNHGMMKDSKKFTSEKKIQEAAEYIKQHALAWTVTWEDEDAIDKLNIRQCVLKSMHNSIGQSMKKYLDTSTNLGTPDDSDNSDDTGDQTTFMLLVDGNDFKPYMIYDISANYMKMIPHVCIKGGDNKYSAIAAASILAKVERDKYIEELCDEHPMLEEKYNIRKNKGYGTKLHMDGIKEHGISKWHRKTYGICKQYA